MENTRIVQILPSFNLSLALTSKNTTNSLEQEEMLKLAKVPKESEFVCTYCFKQFPSAQAMGGHQNAHRNQRSEERRLSVKDPISHRKRASLHRNQGAEGESSHQGGKRAKDAQSPGAGGSNIQVIDQDDAPLKETLSLLDKVGAGVVILPREDANGVVLRLELGCYTEAPDLTLKL